MIKPRLAPAGRLFTHGGSDAFFDRETPLVYTFERDASGTGTAVWFLQGTTRMTMTRVP